MARVISRAESWEKIHTAFTQINFNAFDYDTVKESLLDYIKIYYPEYFNDMIESSEFIAILELFAYVAEILAYRLDLNAHENIITVAERKESILRLAKLVSYKASRNIPGRGLVKLTSIKTTEKVIDSKSRNLANRTISWNDPNNPDWKEQFLVVMNRVMEQNFGTVLPNERVQIGDVLFELYSFNNAPISSDGRSVFSYSASDQMEIVPITMADGGIEEKRPERNLKFSLVYSYDGLGDGSDTTGFLMLTKQGTLFRREATFDGKTPNQTFDIAEPNINETDVWVNNVEPNSGEIIPSDPTDNIITHSSDGSSRYGEWIEVDTVNGENIIFNTVANRNKYEIETLDEDGVRIIFGDGEFGSIPSGSFDMWYRVSANTGENILKASARNQQLSFNYVDYLGNNQKFTFTFSLTSSILNASASEDLERIRQTAPSVYYTQDRMVNGQDYNSFMLQDPTILKLRSINRTFAGDSKYMAWHDPKEYYENVKIFGEDSALYWVEHAPDKGGLTIVNQPLAPEVVIQNYLEPLLSTSDLYSVLAPEMEKLNIDPSRMRTTFNNTPYSFDDTSDEQSAIVASLDLAIVTTSIVNLYYSVRYDEWTVETHPCDGNPACPYGDANSVWAIQVGAVFSGSNHSGWEVRWRTKRLIAHSESTKFWNTNTVNDLTDYDSFNAAHDNFVVLQANVDADRVGIMPQNFNYSIIGQELLEQNLPNAGLPDTHRLSVLPEDLNGDGIPDNLLQSEVLDFIVENDYDWFLNNGYLVESAYEPTITIPQDQSFTLGHEDEDLEVYINDVRIYYSTGDLRLSASEPSGQVVRHEFTFDDGVGPNSGDSIRIKVKDWAYLTRESSTDRWVPQLPTDEIKIAWALDTTTIDDDMRIKRHHGRYPINFAWFHFVPTFNLVDPAASNIIDTFIITNGYYLSMNRWIDGRIDNEPQSPTPLDLRNSYNYLLDSKMISDTVVLQPGKFKVLFGGNAIPELRARLKIIRPSLNSLSDNEVKVRIVNSVKSFFNLQYWEFGEGFFFSELSAAIHADLGPEIDSVVLVPTHSQNQFGDMYQVQARENEVFLPDLSPSDIDVVQEYTPDNIKQNPED